jgi:TolB-like protein
MKFGNIFAELKRRNVIRAAILYVGAVWALGQGISQLGPSVGAPEWATRWFLVAAGIGFPFWIAFAWFYEFTPEGLKRESEIDPADTIAHHTGRKLDFAIIGVLTVAVVLLLTDRFVLRHGVNQATVISIVEKSIAVLPFENLSSDKENAYFTDGIQDEILTHLAKVADLKVISRTSVMQYKSGVARNLRKIGEELGVAHVLEGSVQRAANKVRVNAQLIDARDDRHEWAENYDRPIDDVFAIQSEIAKAIAEQLNAKLSGEEQKAVTEKPTQNAAAYDVYLRAIALDNAATLETTKKVAGLYAEAVRLDPQFALAWARLAVARSQLHFNGMDLETNSGAAVKEAADRAISLQPELGEAWLAQGVYRYRILRDFQGALQSYDEALRRLPNSAFVLGQMAHLERRLGQFDVAQKHYQAGRTIGSAQHRHPFNLGRHIPNCPSLRRSAGGR